MLWKMSPTMIGIWIGTGWAPRRSRIIWTAPKKSAPTRSILLTKAMPRNVVLVGLAPDRLALRLDPADRAEDGDRAVQDPQATARPRP